MGEKTDPRDKEIARHISAYRKAKPGTSYHEAFRALCFDQPWAGVLDRDLAGLSALKGREDQ